MRISRCLHTGPRSEPCPGAPARPSSRSPSSTPAGSRADAAAPAPRPSYRSSRAYRGSSTTAPSSGPPPGPAWPPSAPHRTAPASSSTGTWDAPSAAPRSGAASTPRPLQPILDGARAAADLSFAEPDPDPDEKPIPLDLGIDRNIATAETWLVSRRKNADARISRPLRRRIAARFHHNLRHLRAALAANPDAIKAFDQTVRLLNAVAGITPDTELLDDLLGTDEAGQRVRQWAARFPTGMIAALEPALDENGHAFSSYFPVWQTLGIRDAVIAGRPDREVLARLHAGKRSDGPASDLPAGRLRTAFSSPTRAIRRFRHVRNPDGDRSLGGQAITPDEAARYARIVAGGRPQHDLPPEHLAIDHDIAHANFGLDRTDPAVAALRRRLLERARNRLARLDAHGIDALPKSVAAAARRYGLPLRPTGLRCAVLAMQDFNDLRREHRDARISARDAFLPGHTLPADIFDPRPVDNPWDALYRHRGTGTPRWQEWIGFAERWRDGGGPRHRRRRRPHRRGTQCKDSLGKPRAAPGQRRRHYADPLRPGPLR